MKKYEILGKVGQGGMGVVYKAVQKNLNREVAIKILPKAYSENPEVQSRFVSEMQICGSLVHPNIIRVFDNGEQDGTLYYVMEYIPGTSLLELVQAKGAQSVDKALKYTSDMLDAMNYYHPKGLVHRDIKPANIMVKEATNEAVLMDFGLVKALYLSGITLQGRLVGTPRYMSPEMLKGITVDGRSDIFQLGLVLYELLTGVPAFRGKDRAEVTRKLLEENPEKPSHLNPLLNASIENLIANSVEKNIDVRYQNPGEFLEDIAVAREGGKVQRRGGARKMQVVSQIAPSAEGEEESGSGEAVPADQPTVPVEPGPEVSPRLVAAVSKALTGLLLLLLLVAYMLYPGVQKSYNSRDIRVEADFDQARITWLSDDPYMTVIEYGESPALMRVYSPPDGSEAVTDHQVMLRQLSEGTDYKYRFIYPGRQHSPFYELRTTTLTFTALSVKRSGLEALRIEARTSSDVQAILEYRKGSAQGRIPGKRGTRKVHLFTLDSIAPEDAVAVRVVAIGKSGNEKPGEWLDVPSPLGLARAVSQVARRVDLKSWYGKSEAALAKKVSPRKVGQTLQGLWEAEPLFKQLKKFQPIAADFMANPRVPLNGKMSVYHALAYLGDFNFYCAYRKIPFQFPVQVCLPKSFSSSDKARLKTQEIFKKDIVNPFGFFSIGLSGSEEAAESNGRPEKKKEGLQDEKVLIRLDETNRIRQAELVLAVRMDDPLSVFTVQVNGGLTLRFRQLSGGRQRTYSAIYHTFDPRVLEDGANEMIIRLTSVPGHSVPGNSRVRFLALLLDRP